MKLVTPTKPKKHSRGWAPHVRQLKALKRASNGTRENLGSIWTPKS